MTCFFNIHFANSYVALVRSSHLSAKLLACRTNATHTVPSQRSLDCRRLLTARVYSLVYSASITSSSFLLSDELFSAP